MCSNYGIRDVSVTAISKGNHEVNFDHLGLSITSRVLCFQTVPCGGLIHLYAGSSVQRMTGRIMQNHSQRKKKSRRKPWGGRDRAGVLGWRGVYLHISQQRRKTHPDTPHWEERKSRGKGQRGGEGWSGEGVQTEWFTVPKREWINITTQQNTRERKREREGERVSNYFTPMQHAVEIQLRFRLHEWKQKTWNRLLMLSKLQEKQGSPGCSEWMVSWDKTCSVEHTWRGPFLQPPVFILFSFILISSQ